jgi:pyruvate,water dikinase
MEVNIMNNIGVPIVIRHFKDITSEEQKLAGGKGGMLTFLYNNGYPVPEGWVIFPDAFDGKDIKQDAWKKILKTISNKTRGEKLAVRSSALAEDSDFVSFGGQFESLLNIQDEGLREAITQVYNSRFNERVKAYSKAKGISIENEMAVVLQKMIDSELSGVFFTADPVTGDNQVILGNYVSGLGDKLVSGEVDANQFSIEKSSKKYHGPKEAKKIAKRIQNIVKQLEKDFSSPQDVEWSYANEKFYLLQSRPITNLVTYNKFTGEVNDSLVGNHLWSSSNAAEAVPDVTTPLTWSIWDLFHTKTILYPALRHRKYSFAGNIQGRGYFNFSLLYSFYRVIFRNPEAAMSKAEEVLGRIPKVMSKDNIKTYSFSKVFLIKILLQAIPGQLKYARFRKQLPNFVKNTPRWCNEKETEINNSNSLHTLSHLWFNDIKPNLMRSFWIMRAGMNSFSDPYTNLFNDLKKLVGEEETYTLLSNMSGQSGFLESMGPVIGISRISKSEMTLEEFIDKYGHRDPHECEIMHPRPKEDSRWLERQLQEYREASVDIESLHSSHKHRHEKAWVRFQQQYPKKAKKIKQKMQKVSKGAYNREASRSEMMRVFALTRIFMLKLGEVSGYKDRIFFLTLDEIEELLKSHESKGLKYTEARKNTYLMYKTLPTYPVFIKGQFDAFKWSSDPNRRTDYYDSNTPYDFAVKEESNIIEGFAGASGVVEGIVRVVFTPEEGEDLKQDEILVTTLTNVGWTPLFPRAKAIITDTGAPLSHAAIVAREFGIPAVVGTGDATMRLKTGDRVQVDGGRGIIRILE